MRMADWATVESAARRGLACAERAGDDRLRLHALRLLALALVDQGDLEAGRRWRCRAWPKRAAWGCG